MYIGFKQTTPPPPNIICIKLLNRIKCHTKGKTEYSKSVKNVPDTTSSKDGTSVGILLTVGENIAARRLPNSNSACEKIRVIFPCCDKIIWTAIQRLKQQAPDVIYISRNKDVYPLFKVHH